MYCTNCKAKMKDENCFCGNCGTQKIFITNKKKSSLNQQSRYMKEIDSTSEGNRANPVFSVIPFILVSTLMYRFLEFSFYYIDSNKRAFAWLGEIEETTGYILHWIIPLMLSSICIDYISKCILTKMNVNKNVCTKLSISMFTFGSVLWSANIVYDDWSYNDDMSIVLYRISGIYGQLANMTILFASIIFVCGILIGIRRGNR